jgi:hypothetical protein
MSLLLAAISGQVVLAKKKVRALQVDPVYISLDAIASALKQDVKSAASSGVMLTDDLVRC